MWLLLASLGTLVAAEATSGSPLSPSILVFHKPHHSNGPDQLLRAAQLGFRQVHVVVTLPCLIDEQRRVTQYGTFAGERFVALDPQTLADFRDHLGMVFATARKLDLELAITCHLNSWGDIYDWRNFFRFDPLTTYDGYSYQEAMIESVVVALTAAGWDQPVEIALLGEMGRTLFEHPQSYLQIVDALHADERLNEARVGVSLNFDNAIADEEPTDAQWRDFDAMMERCDFLGLSHYRWFDLPVEAADFAAAVEAFRRQFDRPGATAHRGLPLVFSEIGLGGCKENNVPAATAAEAALTPWLGTTSPRHNPWASPELEGLRRDYHRALLEYLAAPPDGVTMEGAYLWSEGSWDPLDIVDRGFFDAEIARQITRHNREMAAAAGVE